MVFSRTRGSIFLEFGIAQETRSLCILALITERRMVSGEGYATMGEGFLAGQRMPVVIVYELDTSFSVLLEVKVDREHYQVKNIRSSDPYMSGISVVRARTSSFEVKVLLLLTLPRYPQRRDRRLMRE
jgi:hypothetical protein